MVYPPPREPAGPGQESVWDYPRPPRCEPSTRLITVQGPDSTPIAETRSGWRVLETSHPPTWYLPPAAVRPGTLIPAVRRATLCEWKGLATYWDVLLTNGEVLPAAAWSYESPTAQFGMITGYLAFSPSSVECAVDGERARPQPGGFYAGWITSDVVGPFKGAAGTLGW